MTTATSDGVVETTPTNEQNAHAALWAASDRGSQFETEYYLTRAVVYALLAISDELRVLADTLD
jgi:hypothetical protein